MRVSMKNAIFCLYRNKSYFLTMPKRILAFKLKIRFASVRSSHRIQPVVIDIMKSITFSKFKNLHIRGYKKKKQISYLADNESIAKKTDVFVKCLE